MTSMNNAAQQILPSLRAWEEEYRLNKSHNLNDDAQAILQLRILSIFIILHGFRLHTVLLVKEPEPKDLEEVQSLLQPSVSFITHVLQESKLIPCRNDDFKQPYWLSCFKVQYEWAISFVIEVILVGRRRGWNEYISSLDDLYTRVLENRCGYLPITVSGVTLITSSYQRELGI